LKERIHPEGAGGPKEEREKKEILTGV